MKMKGRVLLSAAALSQLLYVGPLYAQAAQPEAVEAEGQAADIVVTAQKRQERLLDVPLAITAVTPSALTARNQNRLEDFFREVPGLQLTTVGAGRATPSIRGIVTSTTANPTVGIVIDDVPYGSSSYLGYGSFNIPDFDPSDLQRIEVLRGPQGTLYGAASLGGLIKYVTVDPSTTEVSGRIEAAGSVVEKGELGGSLRGAINLPVAADKLGVRVSGFYRHDPGYVDDYVLGLKDVNSGEIYGGRISALWMPVEGLRVKLGAMYQRRNFDGNPAVDTDSNLHPLAGDLTHSFLIGTGNSDTRAQVYTAAITGDLGSGIELTSLTGYNINTVKGFDDVSGTYAAFAPASYGTIGVSMRNDWKTRKFTQEVRLASATGGTLEWLIGGFYTHEKSDLNFYADAVRPDSGAFVGPVFTDLVPTSFREYAAFGDVTVNFTSKFDVQVGGRYSQNKQHYEEAFALVGFPNDPLVVVDSKDSAFTFLVSPRYKVSPDLMIYARAASGYRPGGPNSGASLGLPSSFESDKTVSYEAGVKGSVLDRKLSYELALYYIDWTNIQLTQRAPAGAYIGNAAKASSRGAELNISYEPGPGTHLAVNGSLGEAKLGSNLPAGSFGSNGDRLPFSPKFSASASIDQDFHTGGRFEPFVGGSVSYVGGRYGLFPSSAAAIRPHLPEYTVVDLRAGLRSDDWRFTAFVSNVGNSRGVTNAGGKGGAVTLPTNPFTINIVQPRTYGITIARTF